MRHETTVTIEGVDIDVTYEIIEDDVNYIDILEVEIGKQDVFTLLDKYIETIESLIYEKLKHNAAN
jgi:hypothetical protein